MSWHPTASLEVLKARAVLVQKIRAFLLNEGYWEVETPIMARYGVTDPYLSNIKLTVQGQELFLQTSPEYHMKRLLCAGSGSIFQIARVCREDEYGRWHNPEFSLLEYYRVGVDHLSLLKEVERLFQSIWSCPSFIIMTYQEAFEAACGINPFSASIETFMSVLARVGLSNVLDPMETDFNQYLFLLMSHVVEPFLARYPGPVAVIDFPEQQAALSRVEQGVAKRFEIYAHGVELANGFYELSDVECQRKRFECDQESRIRLGQPPLTADPRLLDALEAGLPECSGVAIGLDRLFALILKQSTIESVMAFGWSQA